MGETDPKKGMTQNEINEKIIKGHKYGMVVLCLGLLPYIPCFMGLVEVLNSNRCGFWNLVCIVYLVIGWIIFLGLKVLKPGEALVLTLFGNYVGTLKGDGFFWVNPFCTAFNPAAGTKLGQSSDISDRSSSEEMINKKISLKGKIMNRRKTNYTTNIFKLLCVCKEGLIL